jgi:polyvinyl alcohol dehydrogenase (cytochrome)
LISRLLYHRCWALLIAFGLFLFSYQIYSASPSHESITRIDNSLSSQTIDWSNHPGKVFFEKKCASCHTGAVPKAPHRNFLEIMSPPAILAAMDGIMSSHSAGLSVNERRQIVEWLTHSDLEKYVPDPGPPACSSSQYIDTAKPVVATGWGYDTRRFIPSNLSQLKANDLSKLKLKWAFAFPNSTRARSQPVVGFGTIYVGSADGTVYALDLETGCAHWTYKASAEVRTAIVIQALQLSPEAPITARVFFGDHLGRIYAVNALTGEELWRTRPVDHANATITGSPALAGDKLIVPISSLEPITAADPNYICCTFRGAVVALDANSGQTSWIHHTVSREPVERFDKGQGTTVSAPSGAPVWNSPTVDLDRGVIYFGSGENYSGPSDDNSDAVFAVELATGKRLWHRQLTPGDAWNTACMFENTTNCPEEIGPDHDIGASPLLIPLHDSDDILVVGSKSGMLYGLDPDSGELQWQTRASRGGIMGGIHFGMSAEGTTVYVPLNDTPVNSLGKPIMAPGSPGIVAIHARTGEALWRYDRPSECAPGQRCESGFSAAITAIEGAVIAGALDGRLLALNGEIGEVIWEADTTIPVPSINNRIASGGAMSGDGVAVAFGHLIVNSGYGLSGYKPGNALLVYSIDGN